MGTSASSRGPGSGVPLIPPWVEPVVPEGAAPAETSDQDDESSARPEDVPEEGGVQKTDPADAEQRIPIAPPRRFSNARRNLGAFGRDGSSDSLRRGLGHYSKTGMGGAATATRRMGGTSNTAGGLYGVLDALSGNGVVPHGISLDPASLSGKTQREIADAIVDALRPIDGSQDAEASRDSIARALSEVLEENQNADLGNLDAEQIAHIVEIFIANDLACRIDLDVGKAVIEKAPSPAEGIRRVEEMQAYVRQVWRRPSGGVGTPDKR